VLSKLKKYLRQVLQLHKSSIFRHPALLVVVILIIHTIVEFHMLLSCHQNAGKNHDVVIANRSFENVTQFIYLGMTVINRNLIQEEINRRLNSGNAYYHSPYDLFVFSSAV
jgi:hypothetical protein